MLKRLEAEFSRAIAQGDDERADAIANVAMALRDVRRDHDAMLLVLLDSQGITDELLKEIVGAMFDFTHIGGNVPVFAVIDFTRITRVGPDIKVSEALLLYLGSALGDDSVALVTHDDA